MFETLLQGGSGWEYGRDVGRVLVGICLVFSSGGMFSFSFSFLRDIFFSQALLVLFDVVL